MAQPWSQILVQSAFSDELLDELRKELGSAATAPLEIKVDSSITLKTLRAGVAAIKPRLSPCLRDLVSDELREISDDFKFARSARGKYVLAVNDWYQTFHAEVRANPDFKNLYIGAHAELTVVMVAGHADSQATLDHLLALIAAHRPPFKVLTKVKIRPNPPS